MQVAPPSFSCEQPHDTRLACCDAKLECARPAVCRVHRTRTGGVKWKPSFAVTQCTPSDRQSSGQVDVILNAAEAQSVNLVSECHTHNPL